MKEKKKSPRKRFTVTINDEVYPKILELYAVSACRSLSEYVRKVLLQKPVFIKYRSQTADDALQVMIELKKDLANGLNLLSKDDELLKQLLETKFEEICLYMSKIHDQWSSEYKD
jgi:predicted CopG family antitoxin